MGAKRGRAPELVTITPDGPVVRARQPLPVRVAYRFNPSYGGPQWFYDDAWALAWTREAVLVVWFVSEDHVTQAWLPAGNVKRRSSST